MSIFLGNAFDFVQSLEKEDPSSNPLNEKRCHAFPFSFTFTLGCAQVISNYLLQMVVRSVDCGDLGSSVFFPEERLSYIFNQLMQP